MSNVSPSLDADQRVADRELGRLVDSVRFDPRPSNHAPHLNRFSPRPRREAMTRLLALPIVLVAFHSSIQPLPAPLRSELSGRFWHRGCPVALSQLRVLTVTHWGFDGRVHNGQLVVNQSVAAPLARVFQQLYALRFPIRHMRLADAYGPGRSRPADRDISGAFECRQAVPSPCTGGTGTGHWSQHAYGEAIDLNLSTTGH